MDETRENRIENTPILEVKNLKKYFSVPAGLVHAVDDISFSIDAGRTLGVVGESGCGKSTLGRVLIHLLESNAGQILFSGRDITHVDRRELTTLRKKMQMIFQDPYASLDPQKTIKNIIMEPMLFHKTAETRDEAEEKCMELLQKVGIRPEQASRYPHQFSGGQRQRIGIARALAVEPEFIIADEPVSALDVSIQAQILNLMMDLKDEYGFSYLFIAHDLSVVRHISDRLGVMYLGCIVELGSKKDVFENVAHPYTRLLLSAVPTVGEEPIVPPVKLEGEIPNPINLPGGCVFHDRCPDCKDICRTVRPQLKEIAPGHKAACHLFD